MPYTSEMELSLTYKYVCFLIGLSYAIGFLVWQYASNIKYFKTYKSKVLKFPSTPLEIISGVIKKKLSERILR